MSKNYTKYITVTEIEEDFDFFGEYLIGVQLKIFELDNKYFLYDYISGVNNYIISKKLASKKSFKDFLGIYEMSRKTIIYKRLRLKKFSNVVGCSGYSNDYMITYNKNTIIETIDTLGVFAYKANNHNTIGLLALDKVYIPEVISSCQTEAVKKFLLLINFLYFKNFIVE